MNHSVAEVLILIGRFVCRQKFQVYLNVLILIRYCFHAHILDNLHGERATLWEVFFKDMLAFMEGVSRASLSQPNVDSNL